MHIKYNTSHFIDLYKDLNYSKNYRTCRDLLKKCPLIYLNDEFVTIKTKENCLQVHQFFKDDVDTFPINLWDYHRHWSSPQKLKKIFDLKLSPEKDSKIPPPKKDFIQV